MIEVSHLTKKYGHCLAVEDVSFAVADGGICGLLGPNGAGKSTIMNILTGYLSATSGQVAVAGHPLPEEADEAKACVGYLPEQPPLYPEMTVWALPSSRMSLRISITCAGSRPTVGSSRMMIFGLPSRACAMPTRCL